MYLGAMDKIFSSIKTFDDFGPTGLAIGLVYSIFRLKPTLKFENFSGISTMLEL